MALKLVIIGYSFSGKKTIAEFLKEKYNLEVISLELLIQEAMEMVFLFTNFNYFIYFFY